MEHGAGSLRSGWVDAREDALLSFRACFHCSNEAAVPRKSILYVACLEGVAAQTVKRLPAMQETQVRSLGREDPLEKEMATHSSILAGGLQRAGHG